MSCEVALLLPVSEFLEPTHDIQPYNWQSTPQRKGHSSELVID
jgi:hypothetical protein